MALHEQPFSSSWIDGFDGDRELKKLLGLNQPQISERDLNIIRLHAGNLTLGEMLDFLQKGIIPKSVKRSSAP